MWAAEQKIVGTGKTANADLFFTLEHGVAKRAGKHVINQNSLTAGTETLLHDEPLVFI
jgi:hypothetical protein